MSGPLSQLQQAYYDAEDQYAAAYAELQQAAREYGHDQSDVNTQLLSDAQLWVEAAKLIRDQALAAYELERDQ